MNFKNLFNRPKIIGMVSDVNCGKSNTLYYLLDELSKRFDFNVYVYGLKCTFPGTTVFHSVEEMEQIKDSLIILDEVFSLWDLDNRKDKRQIERSLRLINHNNNILIVCGLAENFKKFISAKLDAVIFKKVSFADMINGSRMKNIIMNYKGNEMGSTVVNLAIDEAILFDGKHYTQLHIPYMRKYDSKSKNVKIFVHKKNIKKRTKVCVEDKNGSKLQEKIKSKL